MSHPVRRRVTFLHPDLGIGGAERLVVDAALALKAKGHSVHLLTSHHDPGHCFKETRDGTLDVTTAGDWLPRKLFGQWGYALCAYVRMLYLCLYYGLFSPLRTSEAVFVDQVSAGMPLLRMLCPKNTLLLFYCHYPDKLLSTRREASALKRLYRAPLDWWEEVTTAMADRIMVNSKFTAGVFHDAFPSIKISPDVLYPSIYTRQFDEEMEKDGEKEEEENKADEFTFLSINRYERKKNLPLAIKAFSRLATLRPSAKLKLIVAGGHDPRVDENVEHLQELCCLADDLGVLDKVLFLKNVSFAVKSRLYRNSQALLYTPSGEHFGIVPLEAMYSGLPVLAVNDGGPTETVVDGQTGFLRRPDENEWADAMAALLDGGRNMKERLGRAGRRRVEDNFAFEIFAQRMHRAAMGEQV